jgi:hypothetical protein
VHGGDVVRVGGGVHSERNIRISNIPDPKEHLIKMVDWRACGIHTNKILTHRHFVDLFRPRRSSRQERRHTRATRTPEHALHKIKPASVSSKAGSLILASEELTRECSRGYPAIPGFDSSIFS